MTRILLIVTLFLTSILSIAHDDHILNKTWFSENGFAGHQYVFYRIEGGDIKVIKQIHGSGVCIIKSEIYDVELKGDSLILSNGLDLNSGEISSTPNLFFDNNKIEIKENEQRLILLSPEPLIYNWATTEICDQVDFIGLIRIELPKNEVYKTEAIKNLRIERGK